MTARIPPQPGGLNRHGDGRGMALVTRPQPKKRGASAGGDIATARRTGIDTSTYEGAEQIDPNKPLTEKQRAFVKFWAQGESITSASIRAGYNDGAAIAYRMVRMPNILKLYNQEKALYEEASQMTRKKVMDGLLEAVDMAKMLAEPATMVAGWKTIAQMCGYMAPIEKKLTINTTGSALMQRMAQMSDAELLKEIENHVAGELHGDEEDQG